MSDEEARHWDRIAVWLTGIAVFMFIIPAIIVARNGANIIEATALMATGAGTLVTTIMSKMTIFPRGNNTPAENLLKKARAVRYTAIAMFVTAMGMIVTLMASIIHL